MNGYANGIQIALFLQRVVVLARIGGREGVVWTTCFFLTTCGIYSFPLFCAHILERFVMCHIIQTCFNSVKLFAFSEILALHLPEPVDHALQNQKKTSLAHFFFWKTLIYFEGVESAQIWQPLLWRHRYVFFKHSTKQHFGLGLT